MIHHIIGCCISVILINHNILLYLLILFPSFNKNPETLRKQDINIKHTFNWIGRSETQTDLSSRECATTKVGSVLTAGITALANPACHTIPCFLHRRSSTCALLSDAVVTTRLVHSDLSVVQRSRSNRFAFSQILCVQKE